MRPAKVLCFDVDNTLYPRSSGLGRAMGDRIVHWVRENVDLASLDAVSADLPPPSALTPAFNHPPDIDPSDELVERLCLQYYLDYGLSVVGLVKHHGITPEQELDYLNIVHAPSEQLETYMPHRHEHVSTVEQLTAWREQGTPLFLFSNAHDDHVWRVLDHIGLDKKLFDGLLEYKKMRENCKPSRAAYVLMMELISAKHPQTRPEDVLFFDDAKVNLKTAKEFGFATVLVTGEEVAPHHKESYIDYEVDDVRSLARMREIWANFNQEKPKS